MNYHTKFETKGTGYEWPPLPGSERFKLDEAYGPIRKGREIETCWPHRIERKVSDDGDEAAAINDMAEALGEFKARQEARMDALEVALKRTPLDTESRAIETPATKAFNAWVRRGDAGLTDAERKALVASNDVAGGYLAQPGLTAEILRNLVLLNPLRSVARTMSISTGAALLPKRTGAPTAAWVGEIETRPSTQPSYGMARITPWECACFIDVSQQLLEDGAFSLDAELGFDFAEEFARLEGYAFLRGTGVNQPYGLLDDEDVTELVTGDATHVTADSLIDALYDLPQAFRSNTVWLMNGTTLATVRKLKNGSGEYLWQPGLTPGQPEGLLGRPVVEMPDMPDVSAGATPIALGDLKAGYRIVDRVNLSILRDPYTLATTGQVRFHARRRVGGDVVKPEALRKLKVSAS